MESKHDNEVLQALARIEKKVDALLKMDRSVPPRTAWCPAGFPGPSSPWPLSMLNLFLGYARNGPSEKQTHGPALSLLL